MLDLNDIIDAFNAVEQDPQIDNQLWQSDDILGWLYESYNNVQKKAHKDSKKKTEYHKVSLQSQVYTPRWVVEFLVNNSLGKLYMEMYPDSEIKNRHKIANVPEKRVRDPKPLHQIRLIDPAPGSGNFLLYAFSLFYDLYIDQIENYDARYDEDDIPRLIIEKNLYGIDLDDRAVQLAQLGLWIKAKQKNRQTAKLKFNIVSSDFFLPPYPEVSHIFEEGSTLDKQQQEIIQEIWADLQQAWKFGSLVKIEEKMSIRLHGLMESWNSTQLRMFDEDTLAQYDAFKENFLKNLEVAVARYATRQNNSFLSGKTKDAITYLKLLTTKYDVANANPPYTDSADFGPELKKFVEENFKKPWKFNTNLYASFIKRCYELTLHGGKIAMVHPPTFMYIKTFEDVRAVMVSQLFIDLFVEWGYLGMFHQSARVDAAMYVLDKSEKKADTTFIKLNHIYEGKRYEAFAEAYNHLLENREHPNVYFLPQSKLKIIEGWPFIYWISDGFREKFKVGLIKNNYKVAEGLTTANNDKFLRFWWEIDNNDFNEYPYYAKGGQYNKFYGNVWLKIIWKNNGYAIKSNPGASVRNERFYFKQGVTFSSVGSKGVNYRILNANTLFDSASRSIFSLSNENVYICLSYLNSLLALYTANCLNPTVSTTVGDIERLPYAKPNNNQEKLLIWLTIYCIETKKVINSYRIIEPNFVKSPIVAFQGTSFKDRALLFLSFENVQASKILINEAIINQLIFEVYELSDADREQVEAKMGKSIGDLPVQKEAVEAYREWLMNDKSVEGEESEKVKELQLEHIQKLEVVAFEEERVNEIKEGFPTLYQSNNDLEEFCKRHKVNPINVWYWFRESKVIPKQRMHDIAMEFLADMLREILMEDDDGIIPLVPNAGEKVLMDRIEQKFVEKGFTMAQYNSFGGLLGRELKEYINGHFFRNFSDHLNLFMYLPKTPFIWHLSSGPEQGFDCYIIIYKWNRDRLFRLRSIYIENRERALINRQTDLANDNSPRAQNEKETIRKQLKEIESFKKKVDELLQENYDPKLDDGVGKNIAPLQNKKMLACDVLNAGQLKKYLEADW